MTRTAMLLIAAAMLLACGREDSQSSPPEVSEPAPFELARPNVTMEADPPPPYTYWAPEGSTIRNHPRAPGTWIAEIDGEMRAIYYGDQCGASEYQRFVGEPVESLPEVPAGQIRRVGCVTCPQTSDLRPDRLNVSFDETTGRIVQIACG